MSDVENLGVPEKVFTDHTAHEMVRPITLMELSNNINSLVSGKAEGLDGITNDMLKNTGPTARNMLLELFNNVLIGAQLPNEWKSGDIALILKKPPRTDINNYRPITLISCVSKLLTKILAKRLSAALDKEDIVGPEQNGFRANRSCGDNLFILNTILEFNKSKKLLSHLLFVDLKEAYDRVDRGILLSKLQQLNIPSTFINYLKNYYFQDSVSTIAGGDRTRKQYQKRGLRQGCNLSAVLFILYLSELSRRMKLSGVGTRLPSGELVNVLLFADDIILSSSPDDLLLLKGVLELWCKDFRMSVSASKSKIISPSDDLVCVLADLITGESDILELVSNYKYLGVVQHRSPKITSTSKGKSMVSKANSFKDIIIRTSFSFVDKLVAASSIWNNVAVPAIMYGADVVAISDEVIGELDIVQNKLGKAILGLPLSTANPVVIVELGWKPFRLRVAQSKLSYFKRVCNEAFKGSSLVASCMNEMEPTVWQYTIHEKSPNSPILVFSL